MCDRGKESVKADIERPQIPPVCPEIAAILAKGFKIKAAGERFFPKPVYVLVPSVFKSIFSQSIDDVCQACVQT